MSDTCTATTSPRPGLQLRCDRSAGHEKIPDAPSHERIWHYDFHQDAEWRIDRVSYHHIPAPGVAHHGSPTSELLTVEFCTVGGEG